MLKIQDVISSFYDGSLVEKINQLNDNREKIFEDEFIETEIYGREYIDSCDDQNQYHDKIVKISFSDTKIDLVMAWQTSDENCGSVGKKLFTKAIFINGI